MTGATSSSLLASLPNFVKNLARPLRLPRHVSGEQLVRALRKLDYEATRQRGSLSFLSSHAAVSVRQKLLMSPIEVEREAVQKVA